MKHPFFIPLTFFSFASTSNNMPLSLETKDGQSVDEASALKGKVVALYFSSSWCKLIRHACRRILLYTCHKSILKTNFLHLFNFSGPACKTFTPLLSVLHEEAKEDDIPFEVVYVSSDRSTEDCTKYMKSSHGDWLKASWESRNSLKQEYGVFAGSEQALFPETKRRSGIPTLVVVDPDGKEQVLLDCDSPKVIKEIESKGTKFLDQWQQFKWN